MIIFSLILKYSKFGYRSNYSVFDTVNKPLDIQIKVFAGYLINGETLCI